MEAEANELRSQSFNRAIDALVFIEPQLGKQFSRADLVSHLSSWTRRMCVIAQIQAPTAAPTLHEH
jgi:hypothetical protein